MRPCFTLVNDGPTQRGLAGVHFPAYAAVQPARHCFEELALQLGPARLGGLYRAKRRKLWQGLRSKPCGRLDNLFYWVSKLPVGTLSAASNAAVWHAVARRIKLGKGWAAASRCRFLPVRHAHLQALPWSFLFRLLLRLRSASQSCVSFASPPLLSLSLRNLCPCLRHQSGAQTAHPIMFVLPAWVQDIPQSPVCQHCFWGESYASSLCHLLNSPAEHVDHLPAIMKQRPLQTLSIEASKKMSTWSPH